MQKHIKVYLEYFGFPEYIRCEVCGDIAVDIHHIEPRSKFGKKMKHLQDLITNLIGLCRKCHEKAHKGILSKEYLNELHRSKITNTP